MCAYVLVAAMGLELMELPRFYLLVATALALQNGDRSSAGQGAHLVVMLCLAEF